MALLSLLKPVSAASSLTSNGKMRETLDVIGNTVTSAAARLAASLVTPFGRVVGCRSIYEAQRGRGHRNRDFLCELHDCYQKWEFYWQVEEEAGAGKLRMNYSED